MPTTLGDVVTEVRVLLRSYTGQHERTTHLVADLSPTDTTATVNDGNVVATGVVEIDDELVWGDSSMGGSLSIPPYGRGYMGSVAAAHTTGTQVVVDPTFPRTSIMQAISETAQAVYPMLWSPKAAEFTANAAVASYDLASDAERVLSVSQQTNGPSGYWMPVRKWSLTHDANTTAFPSGKALNIMDAVSPGRTVRVVYAAPFGQMTASTDTLSAAGHPESHRDLLIYGAVFRLLQFVEVARLNMNSVENDERAKYSQPGAASALTRQVKALYDLRLAEERSRLQQLHPITLRFGR